MEIAEANRSISKNMFTEILGDKYAQYFDKIFNSSIEDKDDLIKSIVEESKNDDSLNDTQKKTIETCKLAYEQATGLSNFSVPLIGFIRSENPNIFKIIKNEKRLKRAYWQLNDFVELSGFDMNALDTVFNINKIFMLTNTNIVNGIDVNESNVFASSFITIAITLYSRGLSIYHIVTKWYIIMLLKFIEDIANNIYNKQYIAKNYSRIVNLIKTFNLILYISCEKAGKLDLIKKDSPSNEKEETVSEVKEEVSDVAESDGTSSVRGQKSVVVDNDVSMAEFKKIDEEITKKMNNIKINEVEV